MCENPPLLSEFFCKKKLLIHYHHLVWHFILSSPLLLPPPTMEFCKVCDNMYYITLDESDSNTLTYKCRRCGHVDPLLGRESVCVLKTQLKKSPHQYQHVVNAFTKLDPTLPRIYTMTCPRDTCPTHKTQGPTEVVYKRYDDDGMKYIYICTACDTVWKIDESSPVS